MTDSNNNDELNGEDLLDNPSPDKKKVAGFIGGCLLVLLIGGGFFWIKFAESNPEKANVNTNIATTTTTPSSGDNRTRLSRTFTFFEDKPKDTPDAPVDDASVDDKSDQDKPDQDKPAPPNTNTAYMPTVKTITLDKSLASSSAGLAETNSGVAPAPESLTKMTEAFNLFAKDDKGNSTLSGNKALAGVLYNRDYLLAKGAYIDCVLNTSMNSTVAGMTKCTLTRHIYSDNGTTLLLERGSEVTGEYQADLKQGQSRLFVLWDRIKTPNGVVIDLASPATDSLGAGGVSGHVDTHFWKRFGGAMMLSLVDDIATYAATNGRNNINNFQSSSDSAESMATEALKSTINIPPTFYKNQGERVGIVVARDLDFSTVYQLKVKS